MGDLVITEKANLIAFADIIRDKNKTTSGMSLEEMRNAVSEFKKLPEISGRSFPSFCNYNLPSIPDGLLEEYNYYVITKNPNKFFLGVCNTKPVYETYTPIGIYTSDDENNCKAYYSDNGQWIEYVPTYNNSTGGNRSIAPLSGDNAEMLCSSHNIYYGSYSVFEGDLYFETKPLDFNEQYAVNQEDISNIVSLIKEKTAISGQITFPDGLISLINNGVGLKIATGSFTPSSDTYGYEVTHNLGVPPTFACFVTQGSFSSLVTGARLGGIAYYDKSVDKTHQYTCNYRISGSSQMFNVAMNSDGKLEDYTSPTQYASTCCGVVAYAATNNTIMFGNANQSYMKFSSGKEYQWVVIA